MIGAMAEPIEAPATIERVTKAVMSLLDALEPEQRDKASFPFEDESERRDWAYFPRDFHGLSLLEMRGDQQTHVWRLLEVAVSLMAQAKIGAIMSLESVLGRIERHQSFRRDPGLYFLSVFGEPGSSRWGFRFEGHHVSLNYTIVEGRLLAPTPLFLGSNPAEVWHGDASVLRPVAEEEDAARALLAALDGDRRKRAEVSDIAPWDIVLRNAPKIADEVMPGSVPVRALVQVANETLPDELKPLLRYDRSRPIGLAAAAMTGEQQRLLRDLLDVYIERLPEDAAKAAKARVLAAGLDAVHFAWAGSAERRQPHYYRVQAPNLLIEYDNIQNDANHIHSIWRDPENDFGDLLLEHYARDHVGR